MVLVVAPLATRATAQEPVGHNLEKGLPDPRNQKATRPAEAEPSPPAKRQAPEEPPPAEDPKAGTPTIGTPAIGTPAIGTPTKGAPPPQASGSGASAPAETPVGVAIEPPTETPAEVAPGSGAAQLPEMTSEPDETGERRYVRIALRVTSVRPDGGLLVDRGTDDALATGDLVFLYPRRGGTWVGTVRDVSRRSAAVEVHDESARIEPGTRGEARLPADRDGAPPVPVEPDVVESAGDPSRSGSGGETDVTDGNVDEAVDESRVGFPLRAGRDGTEVPVGSDEAGGGDAAKGEGQGGDRTHPGWSNSDSDFRAGQPLLAGFDPVRPKERPIRASGRVFVAGEFGHATDGDQSDARIRFGTDMTVENPFGMGGALRIGVEDYARTTHDKDERDDDDSGLRIDRLSYSIGGTRFRPHRFEGGRFLQYGMPEFGVLDGFEWGYGEESGHRYGASIGLMPEINERQSQNGDDFQVAGWYEWVADSREQLVLGGGYQKTWHDGDADRDLLVGKLRYLPFDGWNLNGTVWVDYYDSQDEAKDSTFELTQAFVTLNRSTTNGGVDLTYRRVAFPEIDREEFAPLTLEELADNRLDRLSLRTWRRAGSTARVRAEGGVFDDEDDSGGDAELGLAVDGWFSDASTTDLAVFYVDGAFQKSVGGRVSYGVTTESIRWDVRYELAQHRRDGFEGDFNDIGQHRLRGSLDFFLPARWTLSLYGEGSVFDDDGYILGGFQLQKAF